MNSNVVNSVLVIFKEVICSNVCAKIYGFTIRDSLLVYRVYDKFCLQFQ